MSLTHYWDCNGQGCDARTLQPFDMNKYVSPPGYGPQDPEEYGGAKYGEKMWLTGAFSDTLMIECGECIQIQNPDALEANWTAVIMAKNQCPASSNVACRIPHFDVAVPGFDNLQYSTANVCGERAGTGFAKKADSEALGKWYDHCPNTKECADRCDRLPQQFRKSCRLFASWGWTRGDPKNVAHRKVQCPPAFVDHVASLFGPKGVKSDLSLFERHSERPQKNSRLMRTRKAQTVSVSK